MKTGDVLFFKGRSLISKVIAYITKSSYTHVALVIGEDIDGTPLVLEAQRFTKTKIRRIQPSEVFEVYRTELTRKQQFHIELLAYTQEGKAYDYLEMVGLILRSWWKSNRTLIEEKNKLYCSEVVDYIFYVVGVKRLLQIGVGDVYPHELIQVYNLRKVSSISNGYQVVK
jgi:hypothetical protein